MGEPINQPELRTCPNCKATIPADKMFCQYCGTFLAQTEATVLSRQNQKEKKPINIAIIILLSLGILVVIGTLIGVLIKISGTKNERYGSQPKDTYQLSSEDAKETGNYYNPDYSQDSDYDWGGPFSDPVSDTIGNNFPENSGPSYPSQNQNSPPSTGNNTEEPKEPTAVKITGTSFEGSLTKENDCLYYTYTAPASGVYRFDFDINDTTANYRFKLLDNKKTVLSDAYYERIDPGTTVTLSKGITYSIEILLNGSKSCNFEVKINLPTSTVNVTGSSFSGSISYKDQENTYTYQAQKTGYHRFSFDISDVNANFKITIKNSKNSTIRDTTYSQAAYAIKYPGVTAELTAGEIYTITIVQKTGLCNYDVSIGIPDDIITITKKVNGKIDFIDKENTYKFTAPKTGSYTFNVTISDVNANYTFILKNSNNKVELSSKYSSLAYANKVPGVTLNLVEGTTYTLTIGYSLNLCDYSVEIIAP